MVNIKVKNCNKKYPNYINKNHNYHKNYMNNKKLIIKWNYFTQKMSYCNKLMRSKIRKFI